ncbi:MAG TPA: Ig-like domain-containing protein [Steroidobacteraceae bacterium]
MNLRAFRTPLAIVASLVLVACGGGGGGGNPRPPQSQSISFAQAGPLTLAVGATVTNAASGGNGTGAIAYQSSNTSVLTVNATSGLATGIAVGSATVTATKAADANFSQALATYTINVTLAQQAIAYAQQGPLTVIVGATLTNSASGGGGTGAITYASSDTSVLTVNAASGVVTGVAIGTATVTATKAADASFSQAQATYTVKVRTTTPLTGFIGETSSVMHLPQFISDEFVSAPADTCPTPEDISSCPQVTVDSINSTLFTDLHATLTTPAYHALARGLAVENATLVSAQRFSERIGHAALFFNNRYWVIGGGEPRLPSPTPPPLHTILADIWSSPDGKTWKRETAAAPFGRRWFHQAVVFKGAMWVFSGADTPNTVLTDAWSSTDGVHWTQRATDIGLPFYSTHLNVAVFDGELWAVSGGTTFSSSDGVTWTQRSAPGAIDGGGRGYASLTVFQGSLVYIAGATQNGDPAFARNDVWKSGDGINWTLVTANAQFSKRLRHVAFVMNNKLWVMGGQVPDGGGGTVWALDTWSSVNTAVWVPETTGGMGAAYLTQVVQQPDRVTLIGGVQRGYSNNVWQTSNGRDWNALSANAQFSPRATHGVSFGGEVWIVGGATIEGGLTGARTNEIWRTADGTDWTHVATQGNIFSGRDGHGVIVFDDKLWVIGGWDGDIGSGGNETRLNDVWSSDDGVTWTKHEPVGGVIFTPRVGHDVVVFQNKLWVIGGNTANEVDSAEVWQSADGDTWVPVTQIDAFSPRRSHRVVAFNGELWMVGGAREQLPGADSGTSDVWHSADGATWTFELSGFTPRTRHALEVFNGKMYLIGGVSSENYLNSTVLNDVWSSGDGIQWTQETPVTAFPPRWNTASVVHQNQLWLVGGYGLSFLNDVWRSSDAKTWRLGFSHDIVTPP